MEIGSLRGESLFNASTTARHCTSLSLSKQDLLNFGLSSQAASMHRLFTKNIPNIDHIEANSLTYDFRKITKRFDVIFIDGDHSYRGVVSDTKNAFQLLRDQKESTIIWHDAGNGYEDLRYEVISGIMDAMPPEFHSHLYRVSNSLCAIYTTRDLSSRHLTSPQIPNKVFTINLGYELFPTK
ncbi:MAG: class I SAM-dependent methyltransferase [Saprospiraceae bacterium]|nr:class I SAM-dependent methyltransferase [Saprospiraceae bacterium]